MAIKNQSFWSVTVPRAMSIYANVIFAFLWIGFAITLFVNQGWLDLLWNWSSALPLAPKIIIWLVFLPIMVGLWIWESSWSALARLVGLAAIVAWTFTAVSSLLRTFR